MEAVLRRGTEADYLFLINHGERDAEVEVSAEATDLLTGGPTKDGKVSVAAGDVVVVREPRNR